MGFRNPFRIQVDDNDVAYITDYSPDSEHAAELPRPGRHRPRRDRAQAVQLRLAAVHDARPAVLPLELQHQHAARRDRRRRTSATTRTAARRTRRAGTRRPRRRARVRPPITKPDIWYSYRDNANPPLGTPCLAYYDGSDGTCPQLFPELGHRAASRRTAPRSTSYDPSNPNPTKFPPYYDEAIVPRRVRPGHAARGPAGRAERDLQDQPAARLRRRRGRRARCRSSATTRWTCSSVPTGRSTC